MSKQEKRVVVGVGMAITAFLVLTLGFAEGITLSILLNGTLGIGLIPEKGDK